VTREIGVLAFRSYLFPVAIVILSSLSLSQPSFQNCGLNHVNLCNQVLWKSRW